MKAALALIAIYVGTFFVAIQGASQNPVQAAQSAGAQAAAQQSISTEKLADIRSLLELMGVHDLVTDAESKGLQQFRANLSVTVPDSPRRQEFINSFVAAYQQKFNPDDVTGELVAIYDRHFTDQEIKALLQFYGSPAGQKYAAEMPAIALETQDATRASSTRVAHEVLQDLRQQYPGLATQARLTKPHEGRGMEQNQASGIANSEPETPQQ